MTARTINAGVHSASVAAAALGAAAIRPSANRADLRNRADPNRDHEPDVRPGPPRLPDLPLPCRRRHPRASDDVVGQRRSALAATDPRTARRRHRHAGRGHIRGARRRLPWQQVHPHDQGHGDLGSSRATSSGRVGRRPTCSSMGTSHSRPTFAPSTRTSTAAQPSIGPGSRPHTRAITSGSAAIFAIGPATCSASTSAAARAGLPCASS